MTQTTSVSKLRKEIEEGHRFQLIDVRSPQEFAEGHIPCAVNIPMEQIENRLEDLDHTTPVVLICQSGSRASLTCELLKSERDDVHVLEGGTSAWQASGLNIVSTSPARLPLMRQVQLVAGPLTLVASVLAILADPVWAVLSAFIGAGLTLAGATGWCGLGILLGKMPWNQARRNSVGTLQTSKGSN